VNALRHESEMRVRPAHELRREMLRNRPAPNGGTALAIRYKLLLRSRQQVKRLAEGRSASTEGERPRHASRASRRDAQLSFRA